MLLFLLSSHTLWANEVIVINENFENAPLKEVLQLLKQKYQLKVAFADKAVRGVKITASIANLSVEETFEVLLEGTGLTFELLTSNAVIVKKSKRDDNAKTDFELNVVVQDALTGERLPYSYAWLTPDSIGLTANVEGYFSVPNVNSSKKVLVSYLGYQDTLFAIIDAYKNKRLHIKLTPRTTELKEVVLVYNDRPGNDFKAEGAPGKLTVNPSFTSQAPNAGEVDIFRTLQLLPGVNATNEISSGLNINGGTANQNLVQFDGFTVYHVDHFFGYFSAFNPFAIKSLQLYKTGFEAKYGGRVSGVIDITGKEGNSNKISGALGLNLLSVNSSLEIPLSDNGATLFFSGRRSYTDIWSSSLFDDIFSIFESSLSETESSDPFALPDRQLESSLDPDFHYTDMNLKFSTPIGLKNRLSFSFYNSDDVLNYTQNSDVNFRDTLSINTDNLGFIDWGNVGSSLKFSRQWSSDHFSNMLLSYSFYESNFNEQSTSATISAAEGESISTFNQEQRNNIRDFSFRFDHEWNFGRSNTLLTGIEASAYDTQLKYEALDSIVVDDAKENELLLAHYMQVTLSPLPMLFITPGLRSSYLSTSSEMYFDPRLSFSYAVDKNWSINGATGIYHQFVNQSNTDNFLDSSRDFWILADDEEVPVQQAWHTLLGVEYTDLRTTISVNYFQKNFDGLMEYAFRNGNLITEFDNLDRVFAVGEGTAYGMDVLLKHNTGRFNSWLTYNLQWAEQTFPEINGGSTFYADYDQRHELNWLGSYSAGPFDLSATWVYGSGKPYSDAINNDLVSNTPNNDGVQPNFIRFEQRNSERLPPYHRLDLSVDYNFKWGMTESKVSLSIFNLYDRENILDKQLTLIAPQDRGRRGPILTSQDISLMGITPNISFLVKF